MALFSSVSLLILLLLPDRLSADQLHPTSRLEAALENECELRKLYQAYKQTHSHTRPPNEEKQRLRLFAEEIGKIIKLRKNPLVTWDVGVHFMTDLSYEEKELMTGVNVSRHLNSASNKPNLLRDTILDPSKEIPAEFDLWRDENLVGDVRKQLKGSCWAHAVTCVVQSVLSARSGYMTELAVQELYDCADEPELVRYGGYTWYGYNYIIDNKRLGFEEDSPETESPGGSGTSCAAYKRRRNAFTEWIVTDWDRLPKSAMDLMYHITYTSPVSVVIGTKADHLGSYKGKKYTPIECDTDGDHAVTAVGYNREAYIIKNSWGKDWGHHGYLYWDRNGRTCLLLEWMETIQMEARDPDDKDQSSAWDWLWPFNWGSKMKLKKRARLLE